MLSWLHDLFTSVQELKGAWPEILGAAVGSFLGLGALVLGALYNAKLSRKAEDQKELNDKFGIIEALIAEISSIRVSLERANAELRLLEVDQHAHMPDPARPPGIFGRFIERVELFDRETVLRVSEIYTTLDQYCGTVVIIGGQFNDGVKGRGMLEFDAQVATLVMGINLGLMQTCSEVITFLRTQRLFNRHRVTRA